MNADFKRFAPNKDTTVTVTRKLTAAERKDKQLKAFTDYVVNELFFLPLDRVVICRHGFSYEFKFDNDRVSVNNLSNHYDVILRNGTSEDLKKVLLDRFDIDRFDICDIARLLKRAYKQVNDKRALKGNKPQSKVVKQKVIKKTDLEMFVEEFKQLKAKYPNIEVYGDYDGQPYALDLSATKIIYL